MKGDFSRSTFDPFKHFKGVRMQQGRVQLDADWNENLDILLHRIETETKDVIGLCGFPVHDAGFLALVDPTQLSQAEQDALNEKGLLPLEDGDFLITGGRGYVDGILCENEEPVPFSQQPYVFPHPSPGLDSDGSYAVYLDVWERLITVLEDPSIREVALGGPDTTVRSQVIWQVRALLAGDAGANLNCDAEIKGWPPAAGDGTLCVRTHPEPEPDDPCTIAPGAGYKRLENQLYRVEIHKGSADAGGPIFKYSRDNGSIVVKVEEFSVDGADDKVSVADLGRDEVLGLHELDWVEVLDDATELAGGPGFLVQIDKIDRERLIVTLKQDVTGFDVEGHAKLRRWDSDGELKVEVPSTNDGYLPLEDGIEVRFDDTKNYRTGDYWLIPARTVPGQYGDIEWPLVGTNPACLGPVGIKHHYCKLAIVVVKDGVITQVTDCRDLFPPLTELPTGGEDCCSVTVGEGGDYANLQEAIDARPPGTDFWNVCLLPGEHKLQKPAQISGQIGITIGGCRDQTLLSGAPGQPLLVIQSSSGVRVEGLILKASSEFGAVVALGCKELTVSSCRGQNAGEQSPATGAGLPIPDGPLLVALACVDLTVHSNRFRGLPAVMAQGSQILVNDNFFTGGGVQILLGSKIVAIENNLIFDGAGPGIRLGGVSGAVEGAKIPGVKLTDYNAAYRKAGGLQQLRAVRSTQIVTVKHNLIGSMEGSGILTLTRAIDPDEAGEVEILLIEHNQVINCAQAPDLMLLEERMVGAGINLADVSDVNIHSNLVLANGRRASGCGIIVSNAAGVEIVDNDVLENGSPAGKEGESYQAGIAALYILGNAVTMTESTGGEWGGRRVGTPALRVQGNQVVAPAGLALIAVTIGTTQITDNLLVTRGLRQQPPVIPGIADAACTAQVYNYGLEAWMTGLVGAGQAAFHFDAGSPILLSAAEKAFPDGRILFNDNQLNAIFGLDESVDVRSLPPGVALFSLDDIAFQGNQIRTDVSPGRLLADAFAIGISVRAIGNHFNEPPGSAFFSYVSLGFLMNTTTSNQAVHCIKAFGLKNLEDNNSVLLDALCERLGGIKEIVSSG